MADTNSNNEIKIDGDNNRVYIGSKEKFEPLIDWLKKEVSIKIKGVGKRYAPNLVQFATLNQKIEISKLFSYIDDGFFVKVFNDLARGVLSGEYNINTKSDLLSFIQHIRISLPEDIENDRIILNAWRENNQNNQLRLDENWWSQLDESEKTGYCFLQAKQQREIISKKERFLEFLTSHSTQFYEKNILLITGEALIGKTHLMCDIALNRLNSNQPTVLFFGHEFSDDKSIISNMVSRFEITDCNEIEFLDALNKLGIEHNTRTLIMIDAINETENPKIWQNGIIELCEKIKSYSNLALAFSIRDVEKNKLITNENEKYIEDEVVEIQHKGFEGIEIEAVQIFCDALGVEFPKVPLHTNRLFVNPGMLFLYIEIIKETTQKVDATIVNPTTIFKAYIDKLNKKFSQLHNIDEDDRVVEEAINHFISLGTQQNYTHFYLPQKLVSKEIKSIHEKVLEFLKSEGVLNRLKTKDEVSLYFTYQKFENYFIAGYLLNDFEKNKDAIFNLIKNYDRAISEALFVQVTEKLNKEIFELNVWLIRDVYICELYIDGLVWRHPETINEKTFKYINFILSHHNHLEAYLNVVLQLSTIPKHPFNIERFHNRLLEFQLSERDDHWSVYLHNSYINDGIVKRIINWAWDKEVSFEINDDSLYLYGLTLGWFLTSSNRILRDGVTKALVNIFTNRVDVFCKVLREFEGVNDLYVLERLYAVGYGITLRSTNYNGFQELGDYIYQTIFNVETVIEHILLRDYAKLTVEYIKNKSLLNIDLKKVQPPYRSVMPSSYPTNEEIENHRDLLGSGISSIINSMRTESMGFYGDFGRYIFQANLRHFNLQLIKFQDLSNFAVKVILEEYISDMALFEDAESRLQTRSSSRYDHNIERIGKKYQWMALYKVLAMVADNFEIEDYQEWKKFIPYEGTYQSYIRNIDPTTILKNKYEKDNAWAINLTADFEHLELSDIEWMGSVEKLPTISGLIDLVQNEEEFFMLSTSLSADGNKEKEKYRNLYYHIDSFIIEKKNLNTFVDWAKKQNFYGQDKMPKTSNFHEVYLREYPNSQAYAHIDSYYYGQMDWEDTFENKAKKIPCKVLLTSTTYSNEGQSYDKSVEESIEIYLPNKWLINNLNLKQTLKDGEWVNNGGEVVFFDQAIKSNIELEYKSNNALIANKELLLKFLDENELSIVWIMWGEKQVHETEINYNHDDFLGIAEIDGFAYFNGNKIVDESIKIRFEEKN